jgi:protein-tyrosine phosphatase
MSNVKMYNTGKISVYAGPGRDAKGVDGWKVCTLQAETPHCGRWDYRLPIPDFNVPEEKATRRCLWWLLVQTILKMELVFVGCAGGKGRTGVILALLTRIALGCSGPVAIDIVRREYNPHAVETKAQEEFVSAFKITTLRAAYKAMSFIC